MSECDDNPWTLPIPTDPEANQILEQLIAEGLASGEIEERNGGYRLTPKGRLATQRMLDEIEQG
jgi:DNA-binding PadR family transcriptional regulator